MVPYPDVEFADRLEHSLDETLRLEITPAVTAARLNTLLERIAVTSDVAAPPADAGIADPESAVSAWNAAQPH
jgi:hypothetical protein